MWSVRTCIATLILVMLIMPSSIQAPAVTEDDSFHILSTPSLADKGMETFDHLPNGLKDPSMIDLGIGMLTLHDVSSGEETVILGGQLVSSVRAHTSNAAVATFTPRSQGDSWSMSSEVYPARDLSVNKAFGMPSPLNVMNITLESDRAAVASVVLQVGELGEEGIKVRPGPGGEWTSVVDDVLPGYSRRHDPSPTAVKSQEGMYGNRSDHYVVGFERSGNEISVLVHHVADGTSILIYRDTFTASEPLASPRMVYRVDAEIVLSSENYVMMNCWYIDNMRFVDHLARYASVNPSYEYIFQGRPAYLCLRDLDDRPIADASVIIGGVAASYVPERQRYEAHLGLAVDWAAEVPYSVYVDGHSFEGILHVTTMSDLPYGVGLPLWWNGWDWVSVFGVDDPPPSTALNIYSRYDHPVSSYMISPSGYSEMVLATQSEMAVHGPHDYHHQGTKFWSDAVTAARSGQSGMDRTFDYASRWDDPSYVGVGDTYITKACPANWASPAMVHAMYDEGFRIMGRSASYCSAVTTQLMGAWWDGSGANAWYPYEPVQLMNIMRNPCTDNPIPSSTWDYVRSVASSGGVVSIYNHARISSSAVDLLHWIDDPKTDFAYENWKATSGEVASYVYGRWTTDASYVAALSNDSVSVYDVSRQDPHAMRYWNVPVTLSFDLSKLPHEVVDIVLSEGDRVYRSSDGTLGKLQAARIMDVGYDVRDGFLYVSHFWNSSSQLTLLSYDDLPLPQPLDPDNTADPDNSTVPDGTIDPEGPLAPEPPRPVLPSDPDRMNGPGLPDGPSQPVGLSKGPPLSPWIIGSAVATAAAVLISCLLVMRRQGG